jgi:hypothetical protein
MSPEAVRYQLDTTYIYLHPPPPAARPMDPNQVAVNAFVASLMRDNGHYVRSSFFPEGTTVSRILLNDWAPSDDVWVERWDQQLQKLTWAPQVIVFINPLKSLVAAVREARHSACPVRYVPHPERVDLAVDGAFLERILRALDVGPPGATPGTGITWLDWW